jgi:hypothetical protein
MNKSCLLHAVEPEQFRPARLTFVLTQIWAIRISDTIVQSLVLTASRRARHVHRLRRALTGPSSRAIFPPLSAPIQSITPAETETLVRNNRATPSARDAPAINISE